jgi:hypothetical protein
MPARANLVNVLLQHCGQNLRTPDNGVLECRFADGLEALKFGDAEQHDVLVQFLVGSISIGQEVLDASRLAKGWQQLIANGAELRVIGSL